MVRGRVEGQHIAVGEAGKRHIEQFGKGGRTATASTASARSDTPGGQPAGNPKVLVGGLEGDIPVGVEHEERLGFEGGDTGGQRLEHIGRDIVREVDVLGGIALVGVAYGLGGGRRGRLACRPGLFLAVAERDLVGRYRGLALVDDDGVHDDANRTSIIHERDFLVVAGEVVATARPLEIPQFDVGVVGIIVATSFDEVAVDKHHKVPGPDDAVVLNHVLRINLRGVLPPFHGGVGKEFLGRLEQLGFGHPDIGFGHRNIQKHELVVGLNRIVGVREPLGKGLVLGTPALQHPGIRGLVVLHIVDGERTPGALAGAHRNRLAVAEGRLLVDVETDLPDGDREGLGAEERDRVGGVAREGNRVRAAAVLDGLGNHHTGLETDGLPGGKGLAGNRQRGGLESPGGRVGGGLLHLGLPFADEGFGRVVVDAVGPDDDGKVAERTREGGRTRDRDIELEGVVARAVHSDGLCVERVERQLGKSRDGGYHRPGVGEGHALGVGLDRSLAVRASLAGVEGCGRGKHPVDALVLVRVNRRGRVVFRRGRTEGEANHLNGRVADGRVDGWIFPASVKVHGRRTEAVLLNRHRVLNIRLRRIGKPIGQSPAGIGVHLIDGEHQVLDVHRLRVLDLLAVVPAREHVLVRAVGEDAVGDFLGIGRDAGERGKATALAVCVSAVVRVDAATADDDGVDAVLDGVNPTHIGPDFIHFVKALQDVHPGHRELPRFEHHRVKVGVHAVPFGGGDADGPGLNAVHIVLVAEAGFKPPGQPVHAFVGGDRRLGGEVDAVVAFHKVAEGAVFELLGRIVELDTLEHERAPVRPATGLLLDLRDGIDAVAVARAVVIHIAPRLKGEKAGYGHLPELQESRLHILPREGRRTRVEGRAGGGIYRVPCHYLSTIAPFESVIRVTGSFTLNSTVNISRTLSLLSTS